MRSWREPHSSSSSSIVDQQRIRSLGRAKRGERVRRGTWIIKKRARRSFQHRGEKVVDDRGGRTQIVGSISTSGERRSGRYGGPVILNGRRRGRFLGY